MCELTINAESYRVIRDLVMRQKQGYRASQWLQLIEGDERCSHISKVEDYFCKLLEDEVLVSDRYNQQILYASNYAEERDALVKGRAKKVKGLNEISEFPDLASFRTILKYLASIYEACNYKFEFALDDTKNYSVIRDLNIYNSISVSISDDVEISVEVNNSKYLHSIDSKIIGFPLYIKEYKDESDNKRKTIVPVFILYLDRDSNNYQISGKKGTFTVKANNAPIINSAFYELASDWLNKKRQEFKDDLYNLERAINVSESLSLSTDLLDRYANTLSDIFSDICNSTLSFSYRERKSLDTNVIAGKIVNSYILGSINKSGFTDGVAKDLSYIAENASDEEIKSSALRFFFQDNSNQDIDTSDTRELYENYLIHPCVNLQIPTEGKQLSVDVDQQKALFSMLKNGVTVVEGPPGTGKTQTIVSTAYNAMLRGQRCLVTSFNNAAIDAFNEKAKVNGISFVKFLKADKTHASTTLSFNDLSNEISNRLNVNHLETFEVLKDLCDEITKSEQKLLKLNALVKLYDEELNSSQALFEQAYFSFCKKLTVRQKGFFTKRVLKLKTNELFVINAFDNRLDLKSAFEKFEKGIGLLRLLYKFKTTKRELNFISFGYVLFFYWLHTSMRRNKEGLYLCIERYEAVLTKVRQFVKMCAELELNIETDINSSKDSDAKSYFVDFHELINKKRESIENSVEKLSYQVVRLLDNINDGSSAKVLQSDANSLVRLIDRKEEDGVIKKLTEIVFKYYQVCSNTLSSLHASLPLVSGLFDLVIIDEAAQCSFIPAIPALFRAKRIAIVGDPHQLQPINHYHSGLVDMTKASLKIRDGGYKADLDLYNFVRISAIQSVKYMLTHNRRSHPNIVNYISHYFYSDRLCAEVKDDPYRGP